MLTQKFNLNTLGELMFKTIELTAHGKDCNSIVVLDDQLNTAIVHEGYIPRGMCIGGGDDVRLTIDIATGTIVGWDAERVRERLTEMLDDDDN